ncbi:MAG: hypothetical protein ACRC5A_14270 [Enterobacteriaceae bacterium]
MSGIHIGKQIISDAVQSLAGKEVKPSTPYSQNKVARFFEKCLNFVSGENFGKLLLAKRKEEWENAVTELKQSITEALDAWGENELGPGDSIEFMCGTRGYTITQQADGKGLRISEGQDYHKGTLIEDINTFNELRSGLNAPEANDYDDGWATPAQILGETQNTSAQKPQPIYAQVKKPPKTEAPPTAAKGTHAGPPRPLNLVRWINWLRALRPRNQTITNMAGQRHLSFWERRISTMTGRMSLLCWQSDKHQLRRNPLFMKISISPKKKRLRRQSRPGRPMLPRQSPPDNLLRLLPGPLRPLISNR